VLLGGGIKTDDPEEEPEKVGKEERTRKPVGSRKESPTKSLETTRRDKKIQIAGEK